MDGFGQQVNFDKRIENLGSYAIRLLNTYYIQTQNFEALDTSI